MDLSKLVTFPNPLYDGIDWKIDAIDGVDEAEMFLWGGFCGVHTVFTHNQVAHWKGVGWTVLVHPESTLEVVQGADGSGSTAYLWNEVLNSPAGSRFAVGTEGHFVRNLKEQAALKGIKVEHLADITSDETNEVGGDIVGNIRGGCGCATMSRNDPPHLAGMLDLLRKGEAPDLNRVFAGDTIDETTAKRDRLTGEERNVMVADARLALQRMIEITEASKK